MPEPRSVSGAPDAPPSPSLTGERGPIAPVDGLGGSSVLRRNLLLRLRHDGPSAPEDLAAGLGASRTGVLQQLHALEAAGLVSRRAIRHGVGRPRHVYDLAAEAQSLFPSNYDGLASDLLAAVEWVGGAGLVSEVFAARRAMTAERIRARMADRVPAGASLIERVRELAVIQDEHGYLADFEVETDGTIRLREHNCAIFDVACNHRAACASELDLFRDVLGADVVRDSHIASGDRCCSYRISPRPT